MNRKFDELIKKKLDNYDSKYPDHMWESIAKNLPEKKRRPYYLWFLVIFLALVSYGLTYYSFKKLNDVNKVEKVPVSDNLKNETPLDVQSGGTSTSFENKSQVLSGEIQSNRDVFVNSENNDEVKSFGNVGSSMQKVDKLNKNQLTNIDNNNRRSTGSSINPSSKLLHLDNNETYVNINNEGNETSFVASGDINPEAERTVRQSISSLNVAGLSLLNHQALMSSFSVTSLEDELSELAKKHAALACPTFVKKQNTNTLEFYFSNDFARRTLDIKRGDGVNYLNLRTSTEVAHLSNSFGFRLGMGWESGIAFKTGLNYTSINEKFIYTDPNSIQKKTITVVKYKYDDNLNIIDSTVTQEIVEIPGTNTIVSKNRYSFIDIPVLFQYSIPGKKRLSYDVTVGPYINLLVNQSGRILNESGKKIISLDNEDGSKLFKNNVGVSFYGSLAINYQLTKQMKISLEPNVRYMPSSITSYTNNLDQKYLIAGISAGAKIRI